MMNKHTRIEALDLLDQYYGEEKCGLNFNTPFECLIATMLSAQCTDVRVNIVTSDLFKTYHTPETFLTLNESELKEKIKTCGLANSKAKNILLTCHQLLEEHDGEVPRTMEELTALPGVGRKTANVVLSNAFGVPAIAVDTHVFRVSRKLGLARGNNVTQVEQSLMKNVPKDRWSRTHHELIWHGRKICSARNPKCDICPLNTLCEDYLKRQKSFRKKSAAIKSSSSSESLS